MSSFSKLSYGLTGAILSLIVVVVGAYFINQQGILFGSPESGLDSKFVVNSLSDEAFGSLRGEEGTAEAQGQALGVGGGGGGEIGTGGGGMPGIAPGRIEYSYEYTGDEFTLDQDRVDVLKRIKGQASSGIANLIRGMNFGVIDLGKLSDSKLETVGFSQDKKWGYAAHINFRDGSISINNTYDGWQEIFGVCSINECVRPEPLKESDIPSEGRIIEIANSFIKEFEIKMDNYGQPKVKLNLFIAQYERNGSPYIPESIQVVYPLMIQDRLVYDQWGNEVGLSLNVNFRAMKVTNMYGLTTQDYQSSSYPAETDVDKILALAKEGGVDQPVFYDSVDKKIDLEITTPISIYIRTWRSSNDGGSEELLIPALLFPIVGTDKDQDIYRENIVVPLAKNLLE